MSKISKVLLVHPLGQVGYQFTWQTHRIIIDPYLTDSVAEQFGAHLKRQVAPTLAVGELTGADWTLLTHAHLDHADPASLRALADSSPAMRFLTPYECLPMLAECGIAQERILRCSESWFELARGIRVKVIPAAHTQLERNDVGDLRSVGYLFQFGAEDGEVALTLYHAGDTIPHAEIFAALEGERIDYAFLPVNERNFFKDEADIVGNMTVREAFAMAERIRARVMVPTHWDLFATNGTYPWEIERLHRALNPQCALRLLPCGQMYELT